MPIGNGELAANVWIEPDGELCCYLARTDAWSENARLLKLCRVRVTIDAGWELPDAPIEQTLRPEAGTITMTIGAGTRRTDLKVYVDAGADVLRIDIESVTATDVAIELERWRAESRPIPRDQDASREIHSTSGLADAPSPVVVTSDDLLEPDDKEQQCITWYHRNGGSIYPRNLRLQGLGGYLQPEDDPLLGRTFGGSIRGDGLVNDGPMRLVSSDPREHHHVRVVTHTDQTELVGDWIESLRVRARTADSLGHTRAHERTRQWWDEASNRSYIRLGGTDGARTVRRGYALQRFISLAAGRGSYPIKFNGSLFTADWQVADESFDPDYRRWGGHYWFQNTRLAYWPMLMAGDFDCLDPLFRMYRDALPLARARTQAYYDHAGAFFPETMTFWGTYLESNYGWERGGLADGEIINDYIRYYWQGGLELVLLGLDRYAFEEDAEFRDETLLPLADAVLTFYDEHYPREDGQLRIEPANALETWWDVTDPLPEIVGIAAVIDRLLGRCGADLDPSDRRRWRRLREALPPVPTEAGDDGPVLAPAGEYGSERRNLENPELYAVFPYHTYGVGKPDLELARRTFRQRGNTDNEGWHQDPIQAAVLGLTDTAQELLVDRFGVSYDDARFPAFWGPNYDWIPDQDHGCVGMIALQRMLLQYNADDLRLFPAWPAEWDVSFRLHAPRRTIVEGEYRDGEIASVSVTPASRRDDLVIDRPR